MRIFKSKVSIAVVLAALSAAVSSPTLSAGSKPTAFKNDSRQVDIGFFSKNEKVIPLYYQHGDYWCSHVKPPMLIVRNISGTPVTVTRITLSGLAGGLEAARNIIQKDQVAAIFASMNAYINKLLAGTENGPEAQRLRRLYGEPVIARNGYCESSTLPPSGYAAAGLVEALYFFYEGKAKIDSMIVTVETADRQGAVSEASLAVSLLDFRCAGEYSFPIRGISTAGSLPFGHSHRNANGQEFAIDILDVRRFEDGRFSTCRVPNDDVIMGSDDVSDYYIFGREVCAIGDGVVVTVEAGFPDSLATNPQDFFMERIARLTPILLGGGVSIDNINGGNFVVIDHGNGEFARYCHLRENITVRAGDIVKRGGIIGYVGNSGNSVEPHLHLELLDSAGIGAANGLPVVFRDLDLGSALDSPFFGERNSLLFSEFIFINARQTQ